MTHHPSSHPEPPPSLLQAIKSEGEKFQSYYLWLEQNMPSHFFEEVPHENLLLITHSLMGFDLQDYFSIINLKNAAIVLCLDSPDADLRILYHFASYGIKNYQAYISEKEAPFPGLIAPLRIAVIDFTEAAIKSHEKPLGEELKLALRVFLKQEFPAITDEDFENALSKIHPRFLLSLPVAHRALPLYLFHRAQTRDSCQYEVRYEEHWEEKNTPSMSIILAWRNTPKHHFLYRMARVIHRHGLSMRGVHATYTDPYSSQSILIMAVSLHGSKGEAAWEAADIPDFLREISTFKYFEMADQIEESLVDPKIISGNMANFLRAMVTFIHQALIHLNANVYTIENIQEALCRHPEITCQLCEAFKLKFDPNHHHFEQFSKVSQTFLADVLQLDTGNEIYDTRRKNILHQGMNFINHTLKTNFYRLNYTALSFRLDPQYLDDIPFKRAKKFPEVPYAIFFIRGMYFFGFHIRFKDLSRGGLRTIYPEQVEQMNFERNHVFTECYQLAWTQHKKNKDIPEGGAKGVIFLSAFTQIDLESPILKKELEWLKIDPQEIAQRIQTFRQDQKLEYLYQSQRAFIESLMTIVNCDADGKIRARFIIDYWKKPEYLYLGPDENLHASMIEWMANFSKKHHYKPGIAFISSKPKTGINHKEYGVTSAGLNTYMHQVLEYLGINPEKDLFTVKFSGGPDGDVAGNQLLNLYRFYPHTAKVIAITDGTGTIRDDQGLQLSILQDLFHQSKGIGFYPPDSLSSGGFLINKSHVRHPAAHIREILCWRKVGNHLIEEWLSSSETNYLLHYNVHQTKTDIFIPAGGRPKTLNERNVSEFLDEAGHPTSRAIIEGANLYLTPKARQILEQKGVLIIKDSSANKGGVISSSFEALCGLALKEESFIQYKADLMAEVFQRIKLCASQEADILLRTHKQTNESLCSLSERLSERINQYKYELLDYLQLLPLPSFSQDPLIRCFLNYCLPTLRKHFTVELLNEVPEQHKKAIIACHLASYMVYKKGIDWSPSIIDILPLILSGTALTV